MCVGKLAGFHKPFDARAYILLVHSSFPQRLDNLSALCELLKAEFTHLAKYEPVVAQLKAAQKARNKFVHHGVSVDPQTKKLTMAIGSARGAIKAKVADIA